MLRRNRRPRKPAKRKSAGPRSNRLHGFEPLEDRIALSATPYGAQPNDTAEFLLGTVNVSVVLLESNNVLSADNPTVGSPQEENWTTQSIAAVKQNITEGLQWWVDTLAGITDKHQLSFNIDFSRADSPISTRFEPITQPSTDYQFWVYDLLNDEVDTTGSFATDTKTFNNQQRVANGTDWAFTIFVVNDENDADGRFAPGGLDRAFTFPGGLFVVTPASRPASTISHELGHIFWALDEYPLSTPNQQLLTRGYYNAPNTNAADNPALNSQTREPSIMDRGACDEGGGLLCDAFEQNTSSQSSLELVGWRDSDGDGIFDVLDVDHTLEGTGSYDPATGTYRFVGESSVQTLANLNPRVSSLATESLQNDITINKISRAEYRIDGGAWQTAATPDTYVASLDLTFAVPSSANLVEIRTIDAVTGVTSPVFAADLTKPASTPNAGISGFVFGDANSNGQLETGESGLAGRNVQLVDSSGQPITLQQGIEPDDFAPNALIGPIANATLAAIGSATSGSSVYARSLGNSGTTSTGDQVFSACSFTSGASCSIFTTDWTSRTRQLRIDFDTPVNSVSIDAISNSAADFGRLSVYDANDNLLARYTTASLASGISETMTVSRPTAEIAYAIAGGHADTGVRLDNLVFGAESSTVTDLFGAYSLPNLPDGSYNVQVATATGTQATNPTTQSVVVSSVVPTATADFGFTAFVSSWQNSSNRFDVSGDNSVTPIDALLVINDLNSKGARTLDQTDSTPPYIDVNGDGSVSPLDVLLVINAINQANGESEANGEALPEAIVPNTGPLVAEGEFAPVDPSNNDSPGKQDAEPSLDSIQANSSLAQIPFRFTEAADAIDRSSDAFQAENASFFDDLLTSIGLDSLIDDLASDVASAHSA